MGFAHVYTFKDGKLEKFIIITKSVQTSIHSPKRFHPLLVPVYMNYAENLPILAFTFD